MIAPDWTKSTREPINFGRFIYQFPLDIISSIWQLERSSLNSEFFFSDPNSYTKVREPWLPFYLPIAGGRIVGFIPFPMVLALCEMQTASSRIWTQVPKSISDNNNCYSKGFSRQGVQILHPHHRKIIDTQRRKKESYSVHYEDIFPRVWILHSDQRQNCRRVTYWS